MANLHIYSKPEAGLVYLEADAPLSSPAVYTLDGKPAPAVLLREEAISDNGHRYLFEASKLQQWSPNSPVLYEIQTSDGLRERFGVNEFRTMSNTTLLLNGTPCYLRGYIRGIVAHDHPNMTGGTLKEAAIKNIRQAKKYGFNLVRFHSTIPTTEFVEAADEEGLLIHIEIGFAYEYDSKGKKTELSMDNAKWRETIIKYRNHPSVAIFCIGNELHKAGHHQQVIDLYHAGKALAPGKFIMDNSGWGEYNRASADVFAQHIAYFFPNGVHRQMFHLEDPWLINGSAYDEPQDATMDAASVHATIHRAVTPVKPTLAHEAMHYIDIIDYEALTAKFRAFCQKVGQDYLVANDIQEPRYMTELPKLIERKGLKGKMPDYIKASQKFKMMAIKTYVERCRLSNLCGFEMLQFADCLKYENKNGIVDCFDDDKYIPSNWMRQFNDDAVILADYPRDTYRYGEDIHVEIYISDFLRQPYLTNGDLKLTLRHDGIEECLYDGHHITLVGGLQKIVTLTFALQDHGQAAQQVELIADFQSSNLHLTNFWHLWIYPSPVFKAIPELRLADQNLRSYLENAHAATRANGTILTDVFDEHVLDDLEAGRDVILLYHRDRPGNTFYLPCALERCKPCIWDRGSNLGGMIGPQWLQETMASGKYFDINWYGLLEGGYKVCLDDFPCKVDELVCGVDKPVRDRMRGLMQHQKDFVDTDTLRNFSHLFSLRVGNGTLTVCTFELSRLEDPSVSCFLAALLAAPRHPVAELAPSVFSDYLQAWTKRPPMKEDVMNHFWEIDNKLVEDTLFWEEVHVDLSKLK
ncbi:MAG: hypothetical protein IKX30_06740 [Victivallales bacterium]|nr:hypothetical protein [Victivallales bacterium]